MTTRKRKKPPTSSLSAFFVSTTPKGKACVPPKVIKKLEKEKILPKKQIAELKKNQCPLPEAKPKPKPKKKTPVVIPKKVISTKTFDTANNPMDFLEELTYGAITPDSAARSRAEFGFLDSLIRNKKRSKYFSLTFKQEKWLKDIMKGYYSKRSMPAKKTTTIVKKTPKKAGVHVKWMSSAIRKPKYGGKQVTPYLSEITGPDPQYILAREFINIGFIKEGFTTQGVFNDNLPEGTILEGRNDYDEERGDEYKRFYLVMKGAGVKGTHENLLILGSKRERDDIKKLVNLSPAKRIEIAKKELAFLDKQDQESGTLEYGFNGFQMLDPVTGELSKFGNILIDASTKCIPGKELAKLGKKVNLTVKEKKAFEGNKCLVKGKGTGVTKITDYSTRKGSQMHEITEIVNHPSKKFDVTLTVTGKTFAVPVTGPEAKTYLDSVDRLTRIPMTRWERIGWERKHGESDGYFHLVNKKQKTIPIGFVYHYSQKDPDLNIKITDQRSLYDSKRQRIPVKEGVKLRDYQRKVVDKAIKAKSGIIHAATGSGKTIMGTFIMAEQGLDAVWFTHNLALVEQSAEAIEEFLDIKPGIFTGEEKELIVTPGTDINVVTVPTAAKILDKPASHYIFNIAALEKELPKITDKKTRRKKMKELMKLKVNYQLHDYLTSANVQIFDEAHRLRSKSFETVATETPQARYRFGLSATPWGSTRNDMLRVEKIIGGPVTRISATELIDRGILAKPRIFMMDLPPMVENWKYGKREYRRLLENAVINNVEFNDTVAELTKRILDKKMTALVLVDEIKHGELVQEKLADRDIHSKLLNATKLNKKQQKKILDDFRAKKMNVLIAIVRKIGEGTNLPLLDSVVLADGGKSVIETMQKVGRAMRIPKGSKKKDCLVVDFDRKEKWLGDHSDDRREIYAEEPAFSVESVDMKDFNKKLATVKVK